MSTPSQYANPGPLGLCGFALTTWLLSLINAGLMDGTGMGMVLAMAFAYGGGAQFVAGINEFKKANTFGFTAFCSYGAFWISFALFITFFKNKVPGSMVGWYLLLWGIFTTGMMIASFAKPKALTTVFVLLTITFYLLAFNDLGIAPTGHIGGYCGLLTAIAAFYLAMAEVINDSFGHTVLPVG